VEDWAEIRRLHRAEGCRLGRSPSSFGWAGTRCAGRWAPMGRRSTSGRRGLGCRRVGAADPGATQGVPADAGDGDRGADRLDPGSDHAQGAGAGAAAGVRPTGPASRTTYLPGELAQCDLWFPPTDVPLGAGTPAEHSSSGRRAQAGPRLGGGGGRLTGATVASMRDGHEAAHEDRSEAVPERRALCRSAVPAFVRVERRPSVAASVGGHRSSSPEHRLHGGASVAA